MLDPHEKAPLKEEIIELNETGLKNKQLEKRGLQQRIYQNQRLVDEMTDLLDKKVIRGQTEFKIKKMEEMIEKGKDDEGNELCEADKEAVRIKMKYLKRDMEEGIQEESLRLKITELSSVIEEDSKNLKIVEKQIREKRIVNKHR